MDDARAKVLVVDDTADNRALARATLEDEGYDVVEAASGLDGLETFERERPDCVLLDVRMPGMDGLTVCARIRALTEGAQVPILFFTALRDVDTFDRAIAAGGDDFLTKPVRPAELAVRVRTALRLRRTATELSETYALMRRQRDDLMRLQLQKERLSSFVVHDLKNPLFALDLHAQALLRDPELAPRLRGSVDQIRSEARALLRMVMNLLDISTSEEGKLRAQVRAVDLSVLVADVVAALQVRADAWSVKLRAHIDAPTVRADADLLRRILENLVDNAIRYAPEGSEVQLRAQLGEGGVEIRVADSGAGIGPEHRDRVFEPFAQLQGGAKVVDRTGRGLGLAFCKMAVEAQGGTIRIEDGEPGAVFCVRLPV